MTTALSVSLLVMTGVIAFVCFRLLAHMEISLRLSRESIARQEAALERLIEKVMLDVGVASIHAAERSRNYSSGAGQAVAVPLPLEGAASGNDLGDTVAYQMPGAIG